ncbi:immunoglobulin I-set domain protein [Teladorsagia circumcincta]|uniref:Immunoglobulin I-set domain protein n=1 Tax=Teladorsagia circumcincta TaxID=45464 RepID=A0A2G9V3G4_TELCI|nr:immunoglobulin I-set domain protein [Teladorsagia circumcincta]
MFTLKDDQFIGFRFDSEPKSTTVTDGRILLNCQYTVEKANVKDVRLEWKKDGSLINVKSSSRMFDAQPTDRVVGTGQPAVFQCITQAKPPPAVTWYHNGKVIQSGTDFQILPISNSLEIASAQPRHEGEYKCVVEGAGKRRASLSGRLRIENSLSSQDLEFVSSPRVQAAKEGDDIVLECLVSSKGSAEVRWLKDARQIAIDGLRIRRVGISSLLLSKVVESDSGLYTCRASDTHDSLDRTVAVNVAAAPRLTLRPQNKVAIETTDVELECASSGRPMPTISWFKNGEAIIASDYFVIEPTRLRILGLVKADQGVYQCIAENEAGSDQAVAQLLVDSADSSSIAASSGQPKIASAPLGLKVGSLEAVPGRITNLVARALGPETIEVKWDPPQGGPKALRYKLFYIRNPPEDDDKETQTIISSTAYTLHGMDKFTEYQIRVEAEGENGSGLSSYPLKVRTLSDIPSSPPRDIVAETASSTSVRVTWSEPDPESSNGEITGYRLKYKTRVRGSKGNTFVLDANEREYTITGLDVNTQYLVRMAVVNHNGTGPYSDWLPVATSLMDKEELVLGPPRELRPQAGVDHIVISWLPPADETNIVRGYQIGWGINVPDISMERVGANVLQHRISGLRPSREYVISLRAFNKQGSGFPIYETVK